MSLLDRLRGQPGWRHEDPSVRAAAVDDLESDAQDLFEAIASEDADPGVRLAALARLSDPAAIGRVARTDADAQVRGEAVSTPELADKGFSSISQRRGLRPSVRAPSPAPRSRQQLLPPRAAALEDTRGTNLCPLPKGPWAARPRAAGAQAMVSPPLTESVWPVT